MSGHMFYVHCLRTEHTRAPLGFTVALYICGNLTVGRRYANTIQCWSRRRGYCFQSTSRFPAGVLQEYVLNTWVHQSLKTFGCFVRTLYLCWHHPRYHCVASCSPSWSGLYLPLVLRDLCVNMLCVDTIEKKRVCIACTHIATYCGPYILRIVFPVFPDRNANI